MDSYNYVEVPSEDGKRKIIEVRDSSGNLLYTQHTETPQQRAERREAFYGNYAPKFTLTPGQLKTIRKASQPPSLWTRVKRSLRKKLNDW